MKEKKWEGKRKVIVKKGKGKVINEDSREGKEEEASRKKKSGEGNEIKGRELKVS